MYTSSLRLYLTEKVSSLLVLKQQVSIVLLTALRAKSKKKKVVKGAVFTHATTCPFISFSCLRLVFQSCLESYLDRNFLRAKISL